ncbi:MAG TPA: molybdopterin-dependent oxidoreductase, partial [Roseiflexaceae bacterium]
RSVDGTGTQHVEAGTGAIDIAGVAAGGAVAFDFPDGTRVSIAHAPGNCRVTFSRGTAAAARIAPGQWRIVVVNHDAAAAAPIPVTVNLGLGPHDAPIFPLDDGNFQTAFSQAVRLTAGAFSRIRFRVPEGRRRPLALELIYDARDTIRVQLETPGHDLTEPVYLNNTFDRGLGASLNNFSATPAGGVLYRFADPDGSFFLQVDHRPHPDTGGARNRVRVVFLSRDDGLIRAGNWRLNIFADTVGAGSNGVAEVWFEDMLYRQDSGTSMAAPHIAGLAALMLQQQPAATHETLKQRMLSTARPYVITRGGDTQLPNQWDPAAGWGMVDGAAALLGHGGGIVHNRGGVPAAVGATTGCPVACEDNCLIEVVRDGANVIALRASRAAPYNRAPDRPGGEPLPACPRLDGYLTRYYGQPFAGGERAALETLPSLSLRQPLKRSRDQRGTLNGFAAVGWDDVYRELAARLVDQWSDTGGVVVMEGRPDAGLVRELLFNRFVHHLHRLLGASNTVTKCSFTTKRDVTVLASRVPFGSLSAGAADHGLRELLKGAPAPLHGRADLSLSANVVVWGANLPANAQALWRTIAAARAARGDRLRVFVIDPGLPDLPAFARRISIVPGADRHLALALMLRIAGNPGTFDPDPRFADAARGARRFLATMGDHLDDFVGHVRATAGAYLHLDGGRVVPDAGLTNLCLPGAAAADLARFASDFDALYQAYMAGPTATILGSGPSRYVEGEEHTQYIAALAFLSGNLGIAGGGLSFGEDHHAAFNTTVFATAHETARPVDDRAEQGDLASQETLNAGSLAADAPENTKVLLWFDLDPLTHLPDAAATESLLRRTQLNIQVAPALDDSSRFADIILPLGDTLLSYDLQMARRSPFVNLTQPLKTLDDVGPRPSARILHELLAAVRARLADKFEDDLKPTIDENQYRTGALLLPRARRQELARLFEDANRIPNLLRDALPGDEIANIQAQLRAWFRGVHGGQPTAETDTALTIANQVAFFNRLQVEWMLEALLARYGERGAVLQLYGLLQRGTVLDTARFNGASFGVLPDGGVPLGRGAALGSSLVDLKGSAGFAPERPAYASAVRAVDGGSRGRAAYPMRLIVAQARDYPSTHIPLSAQVSAGAVQLPTVVLNPHSPSIQARSLVSGSRVALVGNVAYAAGRTFETVIARAVVQVDETMALETVLMPPGWHGFDRGGQRLARGVHSEEGEVAALFDNLVRVENENYAPAGNAADRGQRPPKR